ncbi:MAG: UBP-type zinc finger domain-containing protein [Actinobacteria bacterium]|nr:UBP-type zinc finger domain-containing protein [Actinomycetota bacterium]
MLRRSRRGDADAAAPPASCEHLAAVAGDAGPALPQPARCQDCEGDGEHTWAHLRMCLSCGHVACCDSSPSRHASEHFRATGHPVMRSAEPGESWRWCYVDHRLAYPSGSLDGR